jgi:hypothetical protein
MKTENQLVTILRLAVDGVANFSNTVCKLISLGVGTEGGKVLIIPEELSKFGYAKGS